MFMKHLVVSLHESGYRVGVTLKFNKTEVLKGKYRWGNKLNFSRLPGERCASRECKIKTLTAD